MSDKKAMAPEVLVGLIVMLVIFAILFRVDTLIASTITSGAAGEICFWKASLVSLSKAGPKTVFDLDSCPRRMIYVMLDPNDVPAAKREKDVEYVYINKPISRELIKNLAKWYNMPETSFDIKTNDESKKNVLLYRLNEIMAKELKSCWGKLGRGTFDLFDQDLSPVGYELKEADSLKMRLLKSLQLWNIELKKTPKACKTCSLIIFHDNVKNKFKGEEIDLEPFLKNNPAKTLTREAISYYEFLEDDIKQTDFFRPAYKYTADKMQAAVFLRINLHSYIGEIFGDLTSLKITDIVSDRDYKEGRILAVDIPLLIPFDELNDNCDKPA